MNKLHKFDSLFSSSFDELVESFFQQPAGQGRERNSLPLNNIGDYIDLYKDKKVLESKISLLKGQLDNLTDDLHSIENKEIELRQNERALLEEKNVLKIACENKSLFLANMSHEIRTPMSGIFGSLEILKSTALSDEQKRYLGIIETCTQSLLALVDDVLDYSKIEANELKIDSIEFNLKEIVSQVRDILIFKAQEKGLDFTTHIKHNVPVWLKGDPLRIRQVLLNLASNAVKFTDDGHVAIEVSLEKEGKNDVKLNFQVKDTGIGISKEQRRQLFQSYSQVNPEITRKFGGTGLGLAISKKLLDLMKGTIGVRSKQGNGSEFWFKIPLEKQIETKKHQNDLFQLGKQHQVQTTWDKSSRSLLLVEDDAINQKITSLLLEREGYKVSVADNGVKAIELIQKNQFDVILMDIEMPGLNGYETTKKIRSLHNNPLADKILIIAMTAHAMSGDREKCLRAGMNDYIPKPINIPVLNEILGIHFKTNGDKEIIEKEDTSVESNSSIDIAKLDALRHEVEERFDFLVKIYRDSISKKIDSIYAAIEENDMETLRTVAHQLKGSSASFYAGGLVQLSQKMEMKASKENQDNVELLSIAKALETEANSVVACLAQHYPN